MTVSTAAPVRDVGPLRSWLRHHPLAGFFLLAYGLTWLVTLPYLLDLWHIVPNTFTAGFLLKQWIGPAVAAIVMAGIIGGRTAVRELRVSGRRWRIGWRWYVATLVGPPVLVLAGVLVVFGVPGTPPTLSPTLLGAYLGYFVLVFIAVGFPEELGWRGFALPRLQARLGPLRASLILGVLWAGWHLPFFLTPDHGGGPGADVAVVATNFALFTAMVVAMSVVFTFVYNRTGGSVFATAVLHTAIDTPQLVWLPLLLPVGIENSATGEGRLDLAVLVAFGVVAVVIAVLTRGRLGAEEEPAALPVA